MNKLKIKGIKRWNKEGKYTQNNKIDNFIIEFNELCQKHNLSIFIDDKECSFLITEYNESNINELNVYSTVLVDEK